MRKYIRLESLSLALLLTAALTGCVKKDDYYKKDTDEANRKQIVQIYQGGPAAIKINRDGVPPIDTFALLQVRRYPNKVADLSQPLTIKISLKQSLITDYNTANGASVQVLPLAAYTLSEDFTTMTFAAGEAQKAIYIRLNKNQLDLSQTYGIGFSITDPSSSAVVNPDQGEALYIIGVKNKYDGYYEITSGTLVDANGLYTGYYPGSLYYDDTDPRHYSLATAGPTSGLFYDEWFPYANYIVQNIASGGYANTSIRPFITFDPATDKVSSVTNYINAAQVFTVGSTSKFNAADHSIDLDWTQGRWHVTEHWKYLHAR